ncbi:MAG: hypothetical protein LIO74_02000 [Ruminococcus sp.]|nr:hypothetical protein [Ruminococcus sp.]
MEKICELVTRRLKGEGGVRLVAICGVIGLGLILLSGLSVSDDSQEDTNSLTIEESEISISESLTEYETALERSLVEILEQIEGVGSCEVMLTVSGSWQTVYVKDTDADCEESRTQTQENVVILDTDAGESALVERVLSPEINGAIVVCDGASSNVVKERVVDAVTAVLDLPTNRISVLEKIVKNQFQARRTW